MDDTERAERQRRFEARRAGLRANIPASQHQAGRVGAANPFQFGRWVFDGSLTPGAIWGSQGKSGASIGSSGNGARRESSNLANSPHEFDVLTSCVHPDGSLKSKWAEGQAAAGVRVGRWNILRSRKSVPQIGQKWDEKIEEGTRIYASRGILFGGKFDLHTSYDQGRCTGVGGGSALTSPMCDCSQPAWEKG